jgi:hypothetical protein
MYTSARAMKRHKHRSHRHERKVFEQPATIRLKYGLYEWYLEPPPPVYTPGPVVRNQLEKSDCCPWMAPVPAFTQQPSKGTSLASIAEQTRDADETDCLLDSPPCLEELKSLGQRWTPLIQVQAQEPTPAITPLVPVEKASARATAEKPKQSYSEERNPLRKWRRQALEAKGHSEEEVVAILKHDAEMRQHYLLGNLDAESRQRSILGDVTFW